PYVGLQEIGGAVPHVVPELEAVAELFADRDRYSGGVAQPAVAVDVVGEQRLLDEQGRGLGEEAAALHRLAGRPLLVGVQHQHTVVADRLAHGEAALEILAQSGPSDLELERGIAL